MARGRLRGGRTVNTAGDASYRPELAAGDTVVITGEPKRVRRAAGSFVRALIGLAVLIILVLGLTYLAVAGTVITPLRAGDQWVLVTRNAYPLGGAPSGSTVFTQTQPVSTDMITKLQQAVVGVPDGTVVTIIAAPGQVVSQAADGAHIQVNGQDTEYVGPVDPSTVNAKHPGLLDGAYIAECVIGACGTPGTVVIVPQNFVMGEARGLIDGTTLAPIPAPVTPVPSPASDQPGPATEATS